MRIAWLSTRGTSRHDSLCASDGFRGEHPFASVVTVAEGTGGERRSAEIAASIIRDVFAEGVAYRVGEALSEAFSEAGDRIRAEEMRGCSATAAAILGKEAWIVHAGGCRAWLAGPAGARALTGEHTLAGEMGLSPKEPGYRQRSLDLTLQLGQKDLRPQTIHITIGEGECVFLVSSAAWHHIVPSHLSPALLSRGGPERGLEQLMRESKVRFRRQGGAAAAITLGEGPGGRPARRRWLGLVAASGAAAIILLALFLGKPSCGKRGEDEIGVRGISPVSDTTTVFPIPDISESIAVVRTGTSLPVECLVFGDSVAPAGPDTLTAFLTVAPDTLYENLSSGVYYVSSDSLHRPLAEALSSRMGLPAPVPLSRIVVVREADVPAFAAWLPHVDSSEARSTAVVVETRSSVAGGAAWIRGFAIYANGNRARRSEASCYFGAPLEGLPAEHDSTSYRLLFAP